MVSDTTETMLAVRQEEWGGPDTLRLVQTARPSPLPTEVLVEVRAAGVNPVDIFTRQGRAYMRALSLPHIPGWDVAGVVASVGYGVTRFKPGDEVFGMPWFPREAGAYAQYAVAPARQFARKPANLTFQQAAALPLAGLTAWQILADVAALQPGDRVLVNGAAGGVGHLAVQIAKSMGAWVAATASEPKHEFVRGLGADLVVDYRRDDLMEVLRDMDVAVELVGGDTCLMMLKALRPGGLLVSAQAAWTPNLMQAAADAGVRASSYLVEPDGEGLEALARLAEKGELEVHVDRAFGLHEAAQAQELVGLGHTTGKVVLVP